MSDKKLKKLKIVEAEKIKDLYRQLIKEETVPDFKQGMEKLKDHLGEKILKSGAKFPTVEKMSSKDV